ncbi:ABC transporter ATP-binding protein/permease [Limibaculum sp. M0105]|uniref:ABC transporter ATP-binding protein/permease n=1 Tax=Thermohalobaculum xanthum TaxID=2753746 RepID=A0A8J7M5N1_9RHOB|nr:ABC transporter ATP-binding protein/permease [Thermohalobaculum xanthum]MBK0398736.1 ABC transporter ATP-binding protein/permease [Thermohalobaculum xanthum]
MIRVYRKILSLLGPREKRRFALVICMVLIMGLFEAGGVASVFPFLKVLSDPGVIGRNEILSGLYEAGGFQNSNSFLMALGAGVFCIILVGMAVKMATLYAVTRFGQMRSYTLSYRLLRYYLCQNYVWFLTHHSAHLGKNILSEVDEVVNNAILPAVRTISYVVIAIAMTLVLLVADPLMALSVAGVIGGFYGLIYLFSRGRLARLGTEAVLANRDRFHVVSETFGGIKHVKLHGMEGEFLDRFRAPAKRLARNRAARELIGELPRHVLEAVLLGGILLVVLLKLAESNGDLGNVLPIIGLYAFAGIRLFPITQHIYRGVSKMRAAHAALDAIYHSLRSLPGVAVLPQRNSSGADVPPMRIDDGIELRRVTFRYPGSDRDAIRDLTLSIRANTTVAFVGSTGSGKTTLVDIILGLLKPDSGQLLVDGAEVDADALQAWQKCIGYVPQHIFLTDDTVAGNIAFGVPAGRIDRGAVERAARVARLHDFVLKELPGGYDTQIGENGIRLSGGQRQRIGIARALYHDPEMIVLDEATSALDNITERAVMEAVHNLTSSKTIILIAHRLSTVRECEKIFLINRGQLSAEGSFDELLSQNESFRKMCGELTA